MSSSSKTAVTKNELISQYHSDASNLRAVSKRLPITKRTAQSRNAEAEKSILNVVANRSSGPRGGDVTDDVVSGPAVPLVPAAASNASCSTTCCNEAIWQGCERAEVRNTSLPQNTPLL